MLRRRTITFFLSLLLLAFFNSNIPCGVYKYYGVSHTATRLVLNNLVKSTQGEDISFNKIIAKRDHIRVRYMGGECNFNASPFLVNINPPQFVDGSISVANSAYIPGHNKFLFKLRGPPGNYYI